LPVTYNSNCFTPNLQQQIAVDLLRSQLEILTWLAMWVPFTPTGGERLVIILARAQKRSSKVIVLHDTPLARYGGILLVCSNLLLWVCGGSVYDDEFMKLLNKFFFVLPKFS
jgi:hypothetical protein